jgi:hypothetical protein
LALARAVARGSLWRVAPATDPGSATAEVEALARLATACAPSDEDRAAFQSQPERALVDVRAHEGRPATQPLGAFNRGAALFYEWLDNRFGAEPGSLLRGLWALAPTHTPPDAARWAASPTGFDVMRASLGDALWPGSSFDDALVRFAVDRSQLPGVAPRLAWRVPWSSLVAHARRFASPEPLAPTGASYVVVDEIPGAAAGGAFVGLRAQLRVEAQWEDYARMRWIVLKLDAAGKPLAEIPVTSLDRGTQASFTVESLERTRSVLVVGVNLGSTEHPFDPDQGEWEPHGWLLTLEGELSAWPAR